MPPKKDDTPTKPKTKDDYVGANAILELKNSELKQEKINLLEQNLQYNDHITALEQEKADLIAEKADLIAQIQEKKEQHERDTEDLGKANKHISILRECLENSPNKGTLSLIQVNKRLKRNGFNEIVREEGEDA